MAIAYQPGPPKAEVDEDGTITVEWVAENGDRFSLTCAQERVTGVLVTADGRVLSSWQKPVSELIHK